MLCPRMIVDPTDFAFDDVAFAGTGDGGHGDAGAEEKMDAIEALKYIDDHWYKRLAGNKSRWMDLIGDYAGNERFILDGESLLQHVLDDPLLSLARGTGDTSFQVLHAVHSMERLLNEMSRRSAVFDIVFWEDTRHLTLKGGNELLVTSRLLARALLFSHLVEHSSEMGLEVYAFLGLTDPAWNAHRQRTKPMFVMLNDGGTPDDGDYEMAARILIQRTFIFGLLTSGVGVTLLRAAEFRDSKMFSFVLEERFGLETRRSSPPSLWNAVEAGAFELENKLKSQVSQMSLEPLHVTPSSLNDLDLWLKEVLYCLVMHHTQVPDFFWECTSLFVLHIMILPSLSVSERVRQHEVLNEDLVAMLVGAFLPEVYAVLAGFVSKTNRFVDMDGKIFTSILHHTISRAHLGTNALAELVGPEISTRLEAVWGSVNAPLPDFTKLSASFLNSTDPEPSCAGSHEEATVFTLLPFHNAIFDDELAVVHVTVSDQDTPSPSTRLEFSQGTSFWDTKHWHDHHRTILPKHLGGDGLKEADQWSRQRQLRRTQRFMLHMHRLAATLTGASGRVLQSALIPPTGRKISEIIDGPLICKRQRDKDRTDRNILRNQKKKVKPTRPSGRDRIRQKHAEEKKAKEDRSSQEWWLEQLRQVEQMASHEEKMSGLRRLLQNPKTHAGWLSVEVQLYRLHLTIEQWMAEHRREDRIVHDHYTVAIMRIVKELYTSDSLTETAVGVLAGIMVALGFSEYVAPLEDEASNRLQDNREMTFKFVKLLKPKSNKPIHKFMAIRESPVTWQLRAFGDYMDRSMDSAPDPRVSFQPDAWQREVLDCLDEPKSSLLVVAPTSAGKTFLSFYAMEKVLRESDDGILVYVAPSKALVNQVAAEVYARFHKEVDGHTFWCIQTRDYRVHDSHKCQILVTVPEMLAIILLSPPLARTWIPRIRRIILDEIHMIGQNDGGTVWEQIILLAPCPIIGLSATIGEPEKFNAWLESVQRAKGFEHKFIHYPHRYSHLRKFAYFPQLLSNDQPFRGLDSERPRVEMTRFIHPVSTLSFAGSMPPDLSLETADLLHVYEVLTSQNIADAERLDPTAFFSRDTFIRQKDVLRYEADVKNVLARLVAAPNALDPSSPLQQMVKEVEDPLLKETPKSLLNTAPSPSVFFSGLIHLLSELQATNGLPALLFNFDRHKCLLMATHLLNTLEEAEELWRVQSPEWKLKVAKWEAWKARQKKNGRVAHKAAARKRNPDEDDIPPSQQDQHHSWESYFDPQDPSPRFSFAGASSYSKEELREDVASLSWTSTPGFLFEALRRGIAVHHSGMNKTYRVLVERLFRLGFLRVVIATGTLALGINAPTKSSVFCGDSPFLTALTFRQCAGRAGRRGFDLLGRVIFYGIPLDRINRILLSRLPRLTGTFPLSSTMVLRLFNLLEGSNHAPYAVHAIRSILRLPHISFGCNVGKNQLLHHVRFCVDYLRRAHLLSQEGKPVNVFGIASHLCYTEPSNFAFAVLLQSGVIHDVCSQTSLVEAERDLVVILCHLFGRRYLPDVYATTSNICNLVQKGPSCVVLAPLHPKARAVLLAQQKKTLDIFRAYVLAFSSQHADELGPDNRLPLSGVVVGPSDTSTRPRTSLFAHLAETAVQPKARSLFVATSGHDDTFGDVMELARTVRQGVHLNEHAIPTFEYILHPKQPLNAYLYDFFVHGQVDALVNMNGLRRGDVWFVLQAFYLTLMTIRGDLENLLLSMSKASEAASCESDLDNEGMDVSEDSGYQSSEAAEWEEAADETKPSTFKRPRGVFDRDWRVYEVVDSITNNIDVKFKAMWA
ncbi:P-loop containing nucleoside triphosphate hydrolase protein [Russula earlei]|uniref:P-loop containing nucleoside triphosphate hydrolase protein n=1 Tax=Russula earlei TaxID=71964 RepID=A0ACC0UK54_9AGAM|nr:P-loop containing nucleoside triphosphate hydrolase protein [Russula earlei]